MSRKINAPVLPINFLVNIIIALYFFILIFKICYFIHSPSEILQIACMKYALLNHDYCRLSRSLQVCPFRNLKGPVPEMIGTFIAIDLEVSKSIA